MKKSLIPFFVLCFFSFSKVASAQSFKQLDQWLENNTAEMGGRSFFILYKDGKVIYTHAENNLNLRQKVIAKAIAKRSGKEPNLEKYTISTRQPIASCSKWLSAALVMTFVDEGKLKLNDSIGKFLPVFSKNGKGRITVAQCLSHTTAIKVPALKESLAEMSKINSMDEAMNKLAILPMEGEPGKVFHYSNAGLQIVGAVIEKISGKSFEVLFSERIARPLGMRNTDFGKGKVSLPAGGAMSTPEDYINFLVMIMNKGVFNGKRILSESSIVEMQINRVTKDVKVAYAPAEAGDVGYGFGEWVSPTSTRSNLTKAVSSPGLFGSYPFVSNEKKYCAFLMTYYIKSEGRGERYMELKMLIDSL